LDAAAPFSGAEYVSAVPSASGVCCWDRLAAVESQSVMQFLDIRGKLHAARCCKRLLQDASAPFAWQHSPPLLLAVSAEGKKDELAECVRHAVAWASAGLLRFAPVHLSLCQTDDQRRRAQQIDVSAECMAAITRLVTLDGRFLWRPRLWTELLQLPQACNLRELHGQFNDEQMQLIVRLPALERICLRLGRPSCLQLLPTAPALTELSIHTQDNRGPLGLLLEALGRCGPFPAQMRSLQVHSLCLTRIDHGGDAFTALCRLPLMPQLTFLALHNLRVESSTLSSSEVQADDLSSGLSLLTQLRTLQLSQMCVASDILEALPCAPALRRLIFIPLPIPEICDRETRIPPPDVTAHHAAAAHIALHVFLPPSGAIGLLDWLRIDDEQSDSRMRDPSQMEPQFDHLAAWRTLPHVRQHPLTAVTGRCWCCHALPEV
jgi:hypothetical protein